MARVLGAVLRAVVARGTPTRCGVCGSVRGSVAVVSVLCRVWVLFRVQLSVCFLSSGFPWPVVPCCAGRLWAAVSVPFGVSAFFSLCAVHRV